MIFLIAAVHRMFDFFKKGQGKGLPQSLKTEKVSFSKGQLPQKNEKTSRGNFFFFEKNELNEKSCFVKMVKKYFCLKVIFFIFVERDFSIFLKKGQEENKLFSG